MNTAYSSGVDVTSDVTTGRTSATAHISGVLARIKLANPQLNAFTDVVESRALAAATEIDRRRAAGSKLGPLAGVPFAVKNMIDIANVRTRAGSKINSDERVPASCDATLVRRLESVGAILVGSLNMGEYAYDFTGENAHYGPSRNPHDLSRMTGGSSGGGAGRGGRGWPRAIGSGVGYEWINQDSICFLRSFWTQADVRSVIPRGQLPVCKQP